MDSTNTAAHPPEKHSVGQRGIMNKNKKATDYSPTFTGGPNPKNKTKKVQGTIHVCRDLGGEAMIQLWSSQTSKGGRGNGSPVYSADGRSSQDIQVRSKKEKQVTTFLVGDVLEGQTIARATSVPGWFAKGPGGAGFSLNTHSAS